MGADLILATVWTTKDNDALDWGKGVEVIKAATLDQLDPNGFEEEELSDEAIEDLRLRFISELDEVKAYWEGRVDRATDVYAFGPVRVLISGGTSWGDDPSEMFTILTNMPEGTFSAVGFFT